jgi:hypothetical protein
MSGFKAWRACTKEDESALWVADRIQDLWATFESQDGNEAKCDLVYLVVQILWVAVPNQPLQATT